MCIRDSLLPIAVMLTALLMVSYLPLMSDTLHGYMFQKISHGGKSRVNFKSWLSITDSIAQRKLKCKLIAFTIRRKILVRNNQTLSELLTKSAPHQQMMTRANSTGNVPGLRPQPHRRDTPLLLFCISHSVVTGCLRNLPLLH